jgi:hypothetical protein
MVISLRVECFVNDVKVDEEYTVVNLKIEGEAFRASGDNVFLVDGLATLAPSKAASSKDTQPHLAGALCMSTSGRVRRATLYLGICSMTSVKFEITSLCLQI